LVVNPADATEFPLKMVINNQQQEKQGADTGHFKFNYKYLENVLSSTGSEVVFGCNKENNKGYMLFRNKICDKDVDMVSIVAWVS
jgi:DNA polymerase III sliding clamp (beta) subunit (PCNA family)